MGKKHNHAQPTDFDTLNQQALLRSLSLSKCLMVRQAQQHSRSKAMQGNDVVA